MSTTLDLDDRLIAALNKRAEDTNRTLAQVVEEVAQKLLAESPTRENRERIKLHTIGYSHFRPGIDFSNNAALQDLMDELDGHAGR